ncbi:TRAP transporter small permease subunit [Aquicoccus sp. G2-2]|jgi:TRAP-type mannitol/chloroaromatic compound transport system permease small subunit|uniref:TRAP transporter small permease subunit n=1 Tax=Aquicoccus sp. G2-2 TaxID=3092120 RepID=UPI002ADF4D32|nr:TRAP transporter small permease subunit [Aquicoccus sp. G2-2]MEA1112288.1 TRAP transporter small permease subunit [Aquicoccus sp. G2-2]
MSKMLPTDRIANVHDANPVTRMILHVTGAMNIVGSLLILVLMVLIGVDVAGRNLFGAPLSGVPEMVSLSILVIVFLQAPKALQQGRMTRSDTLINMLAARLPFAAKGVETLFDLIGMAVFSIIIYGTLPMLEKAWVRSEFVGAIGDFTAPVWPVRLAVILGSVLLTVNFALRIAQRWKAARHDTV